MRRAYPGLVLMAAAMAAISVPEMTERGLFVPPRKSLPIRHRKRSGVPYHQPGVDTVLMDWDLPKGKRAKRRARGRAAVNIHKGAKS